jgi:uncharacterized protein YfiM (DUF2279 family)
MALHKLVFDATDADTIAASANVGAYLRSADGTLLTHTDVGGKKALDVRVAEGINVEVDLDAADDSVASWTNDGAGNAITSTSENGDQALDVHLSNSSIAVTATDLDIRDLAFATDKVDASGSSVSITGDVNVTQGTDPWVVSATDLDIRDLDAASDSIASWLSDGAGNALSSTAGALDVNIASGTVSINDAALADTALKASAETVGTSAAAIVDGADELANRKYLYLYNNGSKQAYIGQSGVTTSTGFPLPPGSILEARIGAAVDVYMIADAASQNVRALQLS